jgi:hypothetical protein
MMTAAAHTSRDRQINRLVKRSEATGVISNAARGIQVYRFKRTHEGPAVAEAVSDRFINVLSRRDTVIKQTPYFPEQCSLQPVQNEPLNLLEQPDS